MSAGARHRLWEALTVAWAADDAETITVSKDDLSAVLREDADQFAFVTAARRLVRDYERRQA